MSGGSYDYLYLRIRDMAETLRESPDPRRAAFSALLDKVANAAKAIEWNDSGDGDGRENEFIDACFVTGPPCIAEAALHAAKKAREFCDEAVSIIHKMEVGGVKEIIEIRTGRTK